jgi:hypothetical protein
MPLSPSLSPLVPRGAREKITSPNLCRKCATFHHCIADSESLPGFLVNVAALPPESAPAFLAQLCNYAWFIGFAVAFAIDLAMRKFAPRL